MKIGIKSRIQQLFPFRTSGKEQISTEISVASEPAVSIATRLSIPGSAMIELSLGTSIVPGGLYGLFAPLPIPENTDLRASISMLLVPDILDLFSDVVYPGTAGKAYTKPLGRERAKKRKSRRRRRTLFFDSAQRYSERTLDVFDLLLPYLQPPVEAALSDLTLFPEGRRPYHYQAVGIRFLSEHTGALLGDDMGLGKTMQSIIALKLLFQKAKIRRALILCRRSLLSVWESELRKWAPELYFIKVRGTRESRVYLWGSPAPVYLTTYETLRNDIERLPHVGNKFDVVILDEVQEIKNSATKKSRAVRKVAGNYRWGLSGTPLENRVEDVVHIFAYLKPGLFPPSVLTDPSSGITTHFVKTRIKPYFLRRKVEEVLKELPEKVSNTIWLELSPEQRETYNREFSAARARLMGAHHVSRVHIFSTINKLKEICNIDPVTGSSVKIDYLIDQLEDIVGAGQKALVFSQFPNVTLGQIKPRLRRFSPAIFDGSLSDMERKDLIESFQSRPVPKVMLMSVKSGSVGITLTRANHVFHFDHWWNPATAKQAEGRAYRIGQTRTVFVYDVFTKDTIEERIHNLLESKNDLFDDVIDDLAVPGVQKQISDKELYELLDLEPPPDLKR